MIHRNSREFLGTPRDSITSRCVRYDEPAGCRDDRFKVSDQSARTLARPLRSDRYLRYFVSPPTKGLIRIDFIQAFYEDSSLGVY